MPKKQKFKMLDVIDSQFINNIQIQNINLTTSSKTTFDLLKSLYISADEETQKVKYGTGPLAFEGEGTKDQSKICAVLNNQNKTTYLIRAASQNSFDLLNNIVRNNSKNLHDCKITTSEAILGIGIETSYLNLFLDTLEKNKGVQNKKLQISLTKDSIFMIGSASSLKFFQIGLINTSNKNEKGLCILSKIKEVEPKFLKLLDSSNLSLEDFHLIGLRESLNCFEDCELKQILLNFIKSNFSLPSLQKLKTKTRVENPKIRYIRNALKACLKYLENETLATELQPVISEFQEKLKIKNIKSLTNDEKDKKSK